MKGNKRYKKTFPLFAVSIMKRKKTFDTLHDSDQLIFFIYQTIDVATSKFTVLSTKIEINLKKTSGISWASLEPNDQVKTWTTFGVSGGGGTVGGTEMYYNADSPLHHVNKK